MQDNRKKAKSVLKGHYIVAGFEVNEDSVKEMLTLMGVAADESMVQEAIGYLSGNAMEINMNNLYEFLKTKQIMSSRTDIREKKN